MEIRCYRSGACLLLFLCFGCGNAGRPSLVPVTGTVYLDGKPVDGAEISFVPESTAVPGYGRPSRGTTDQSGKFSPGTYQTADGLPLGTFKVIVTKQENLNAQGQPVAMENEEALPEQHRIRWLIPKMYSQTETSGLTAEVTPNGMTPSEFQLRSHPKGVETETVRH